MLHFFQVRQSRLLPNETLLPVLKKDYAAMDEMFIGDALDFDGAMSALGKLEDRINHYAGE